MNISSYKNYLSSRGNNLAQVKRNQSDVILNNTFTLDPTYKKVYILTKDGWKWEDAKYQFHTAPSISKDAVDYYLQFRPKVHYPVGSYVIVPDDTSSDINLTSGEIESPFTQPIENRSQWWLIVGRDEANAYVRYMILKCDWDFRWIYKGKLMSCWACSKSANSYTSWSILPIRYYTARCIWKHCSVFLRICWDTLRAVMPKRKDEISLCGMV